MLEAVGWGAFFIWVGVALLLGLSLSIGLVGVGVITLGVQLARKAFRLPLEGFWVVAGLAFLVGGTWGLLGLSGGLIPVALVAIGALILVSGFRAR